MNTINNQRSLLDTATILEHSNKRQQASQLLLLAIVDEQPRNISEVRRLLHSGLNELKKTAQRDFYFDLGWLESPDTILEDFASLNWVEKHHSTLAYQSTKIGRAELIYQWQNLESYLGMSLTRFQEIC